MTTRRHFIQIVPVAGAALMAGRSAFADLPMVAETDANAVALGYVADASKTKSPAYVAGSHCGSCQLFQGKADAAAGPCGIFAGKQVSSKGWCTAYAKKA